MLVAQTIDNTNPLVSTNELMHRTMFNRTQMKHMKERTKELQIREMDMNAIINKMHTKTRRLESQLNNTKALPPRGVIVVHQLAAPAIEVRKISLRKSRKKIYTKSVLIKTLRKSWHSRSK